MPISSPQPGFAEQDPDMWWQELQQAMKLVKKQVDFSADDIAAIGISYQMRARLRGQGFKTIKAFYYMVIAGQLISGTMR